MTRHYLAFDLGAESGRAMLGTLTGDWAGESPAPPQTLQTSGQASGPRILTLEELHRFANTPVRVFSALYWDALRLFHEICRGLQVAGRERGLTLSGIAVDTWGVDFALLGATGALLENPRHYRDARNNGMVEHACSIVPREDIFGQTGIQFMQINTLCQLIAMKTAGDPALGAARTLLMIPDLLNYWLTGVAKAERTIASTSQLYNPLEKRWASELLERFGLPPSMLPELVDPGALLGPLLPPLAETAGLGPAPVYTTGCHDTASAVAAVPAECGPQGDDAWCYISSGTWSLMGAELAAPVVNERSLAMNMTNEIGAEGKTRLLKNIAGLWLLQECRRQWSADGTEHSYEELARKAAAARPFTAVLDPDRFLEPGNMPRRIAAFCKATGQRTPASAGEFSRTILESLALRYRQVLEMLESLLGRRMAVIHIVGGGSRNTVLNQFVADATGRTVVAGPTEATAAGNILIQAIGAGDVGDLAEARAIVRASFPVERFEPGPRGDWDTAYAKYLTL